MEEVTSCSFNSPLFQQEDRNGVTYRIPALLYVPPTRTFLAFAEKRSTGRDEDALHLVLRRGLRTGHSVQVIHPRSWPGPHFVFIVLCALFLSMLEKPWVGAEEKQRKHTLTKCYMPVHIESSQPFCIISTVVSHIFPVRKLRIKEVAVCPRLCNYNTAVEIGSLQTQSQTYHGALEGNLF